MAIVWIEEAVVLALHEEQLAEHGGDEYDLDGCYAIEDEAPNVVNV